MLHDDPSHADFWRAHHEGRMFLLRGYAEDALDETEPGSVFSLTTPVWRVGESLLHASNVAAILAADDDQAEVEIILQWTGLQGRRLKAQWPMIWSTAHGSLRPRACVRNWCRMVQAILLTPQVTRKTGVTTL